MSSPLLGALRQVALYAHEFKQQVVARAHSDEDDLDMPAHVAAFRANRPVSIVWIHNSDREAVLTTAHDMIIGLGADIVVTGHETYVAESRRSAKEANRNPRTRRRWRPGEMQELAAHHDGLAKGWVTEAIGNVAVNRAGDIVGASQPYRIHSGDAGLGWRARIEWLAPTENLGTVGPDGELRQDWPENDALDPGLEVSGVISDFLIEVMNQPSLRQHLLDDGIRAPDMDPELLEVLLDEALMRNIRAAAPARLNTSITAALLASADQPIRSAYVHEREMGEL